MSHLETPLAEEDEETSYEIYRLWQTRYPTPMAKEHCFGDRESKIAYIAERFKEIMLCLGLDLKDGSLSKTPERVAKMYVDEVFSGLDPKNYPSITTVDNHYQEDELGNFVFVTSAFHSFCEHHFVPMWGKVYVAYLPKDKIIGLSKIPRIIKNFACRPQLQERLTAQIADSLSMILGEDIAVSIIATHFCVIARGIKEQDSVTVTNFFKGCFKQDEMVRRQFFEAIERSKSNGLYP